MPFQKGNKLAAKRKKKLAVKIKGTSVDLKLKAIPTQEQHFSVLFSDGYVYFKMQDLHSCHASVEKGSNMVCNMPTRWWCSNKCHMCMPRKLSVVFDLQREALNKY